LLLYPQQIRPAVDVNAQVWESPAVISIAPDDRLETGVGTSLLAVVPFPSAPVPLVPQQYAAPPEVIAHVWREPLATWVTFDESPDTGAGRSFVFVVPFPSCPSSFFPQHSKPSADEMAHEDSSPMPMPVTPDDSPMTSVGTVLGFVVVSPSCPLLLYPQHQTAPEEASAQVCMMPLEIATTLAGNPETSTGVVV